jgi:recombinase
MRNKRAADFRALALIATIRELKEAGFVSRRALAHELSRRGIPTARGGRWHYTTVVRMLTRLGLITPGKAAVSIALANKQAADARAKTLAPIIGELQAKGLVSLKAIAAELNIRQIPTARGGKWHPTGVSRLLDRLR